MKLFEFCVCKASCGPLNLKHVTCCHGDFPIRSRALSSLRHDTIPSLKLLNESSRRYIGIFIVCNELDFIQVTGSVPLLFKMMADLGWGGVIRCELMSGFVKKSKSSNRCCPRITVYYGAICFCVFVLIAPLRNAIGNRIRSLIGFVSTFDIGQSASSFV